MADAMAMGQTTTPKQAVEMGQSTLFLNGRVLEVERGERPTSPAQPNTHHSLYKGHRQKNANRP